MSNVLDSVSNYDLDGISLTLEESRNKNAMYLTLSWDDGPITISKKTRIPPLFMDKMIKFLEDNKDKVTRERGEG